MSLRCYDLLMQGVEFQPVQIDLSRKPHYFNSVSTSGLVPAVAYKGASITESIPIIRWVDQAFDGPELVPVDKKRRDTMEALMPAANRINAAGLDLLAGRGSRCAGTQDTMRCARRTEPCALSFVVPNLQKAELVRCHLCSKIGLLKGLGSCRSWGIGSGQSNGQRRGLEQQLQVLAQALQEGEGPYLTGGSVTLVRLWHWHLWHPCASRQLRASLYVNSFLESHLQGIHQWIGQQCKD